MNPHCVPWGKGRVPPLRQNTAPAKLFRFTKTFTERCWSSRRSRHELFWIRQNGQPQPDQRAAALAAFNHHLGGISVEHIQTLRDVRHADSSAAHALG